MLRWCKDVVDRVINITINIKSNVEKKEEMLQRCAKISLKAINLALPIAFLKGSSLLRG